MLKFEPFCLYGFCVNYPITWKVEIDPLSNRNKGNVAFKSPKNTYIFVSWGSLKKARKSYSSIDEHVNGVLRDIKKSQGVKKVELILSKPIEINTHKAKLTHVKLILSRFSILPFIKTKKSEQEIRSLHLYCDDSERYFVIYGTTTPEKSDEQGDIFMSMIKSFQCHRQAREDKISENAA